MFFCRTGPRGDEHPEGVSHKTIMSLNLSQSCNSPNILFLFLNNTRNERMNWVINLRSKVANKIILIGEKIERGNNHRWKQKLKFSKQKGIESINKFHVFLWREKKQTVNRTKTLNVETAIYFNQGNNERKDQN